MVKSGDVWRIAQRGMPNNNGVCGDMIIKFDVEFPEKLSVQSAEALASVRKDLDIIGVKTKENGTTTAHVQDKDRIHAAAKVTPAQGASLKAKLLKQAERQQRQQEQSRGGGMGGQQVQCQQQ